MKDISYFKNIISKNKKTKTKFNWFKKSMKNLNKNAF